MQNRPSILLVDTDLENLSEYERLLGCLDAVFIRAVSCEQAADLAQENGVQENGVQENGGACVVIISAEMPGATIQSLMARLRAHTPTLPVILVFPAYPDETAVRQGYAAGVADFLFRPLVPEILVQKVRAQLTLSTQCAGTAGPGAMDDQQKDAEELFRWLSQSMEQIARAMATTVDMIEVPRLVLEQLPEVVPYERGSILLKDGDALRIVAQRGFPEGWPVSNARIRIRKGDIFQQIVESRQALLLDDVMTTSAWQQAEGLPVNHSWLGVPLVSKDSVIGMVSLTRREVAAFQPEEVAFIRASASQAAVALVNARLLNELKRFNEHLEQLVAGRTEELKKAYAKLEKIDQTKTSFISVAAHELRTPLTLIKGYASLLKTMVQENQDADELVDGIMNGEKRLLDVVNSMIDVSKIDNQSLTVRKSPVSVWIILKIIRSEFEVALQERNIHMDVMNLENLPVIQADTELISKLFRQLIGNAIKYTPNGGTINVEGQPSILMGAPAAPETGGDDNAVEILIRDTGIGIDPENLELIFDKFYQTGPVELHSSGKTKFKGGGSGLGLSIAKGIVQAHNGSIWVESPGHDEVNFPGSCFHVMLPIH
jgi:signal transduction histidine kinase